MSGNARGKLKEEFEGVHRNIDWIRVHAQKAQALLAGTHPEINTMLDSMIKEMDALDELTLGVYAKL